MNIFQTSLHICIVKEIFFKQDNMIEKNYNPVFDDYPVPKDFSSYFKEYQNARAQNS